MPLTFNERVFMKHNKSNSLDNRNSAIELLRIIAMYSILGYHFILHNGTRIETLPPSFSRFCYQLFIGGFGKAGVIVFFMISAWYFADKEQTIRACFKRVWIMAREVLFYSYLLAIICTIVGHNTLSKIVILESLIPLSSNLYWYATAYALFLIFLPFLHRALCLIGRSWHIRLAIVFLCLYGIIGFLPFTTITSDNVCTFIYLYTVITAYKWYFKPFSRRALWILLTSGLLILILFDILSNILSTIGFNVGLYANNGIRFPVVLIGFPLFVLAERHTFHSKIINRIAKSMFAVYLITEYPSTRRMLWREELNLQYLPQSVWEVCKIAVILLAILLICTVMDFIRQAIFAITVDRNPGKWFMSLYRWCSIKLHTVQKRSLSNMLKSKDSTPTLSK